MRSLVLAAASRPESEQTLSPIDLQAGGPIRPRLCGRLRRLAKAGLMWALLLLCFAAPAGAQSPGAHGIVRDARSHAPIGLVHVTLTNPADTTQSHATATGDDGSFSIRDLESGPYRLEVERVGYRTVRKDVTVAGWTDLGTIALQPMALNVPGVVVQGLRPPAEQKADTTEFSAKAVKTNPDATAGDLIEKMPGVTVTNGTVKSNGETVQQILVDGKPYFGQDPAIALQNLPAEVIDKIQVFDKMSDQAELTGFDDGQSIKTMNILLRQEKRNGEFAKAYGGSGSDGRYLTGGDTNVMKGDTRFSLIGLADNVNQQNFSAQDLLGVLNTSSQRGGTFSGGPNGRRAGGGGRGGGGGGGGLGGGRGGGGGGGGAGGGFGGSGAFLVGQQNGVTSTGSIGANDSGHWWKGLSVSQSYFFNQTENQNTQHLSRQYAVPVDSIAMYNQDSNTPNTNYNNRYDGRFIDTLSTRTTIVEQPRLYFQNNRASSVLTGANLGPDGNTLAEAENDNSGTTTGDNLTNHLVLRHRFERKGRTVSVDVGNGYTSKDGSATLSSFDRYFQGNSSTLDTLDESTTVRSTTRSASARLVYTEPLGGAGLLQATYFPSETISQSDNRGYNLNPATRQFTVPDTGLSNTFTSTSTAENAGLGYLHRQGLLNLMANFSYQASTLSERQSLPAVTQVDKSFRDFLPFFMLNYNLRGQKNLRVFFTTQTRVPSISQVQNLIDTSNPLAFTTGNPDLKESYVQTLLTRYSTTNKSSGRSIFLLFSVQRMADYLGNSTFTASRDSLLAPGDTLKPGSQLVRPVNLDGYWNVNSFVTYSHPVGLVKSLLNWSSGFTYNRTPGIINDLTNQASTYTLTQGIVLSSDISPQVDFIVSYTGNYNIARNSAVQSQNSNYYNHVGTIKCNLIGLHGVVLNNEVTNNFTKGLGAGYDQDVVLWNLGLGKKLLRGQSGEIRLTATDLLNQNRSVNRTVTDSYIQDAENLTLKRYIMLNFIYTVK